MFDHFFVVNIANAPTIRSAVAVTAAAPAKRPEVESVHKSSFPKSSQSASLFVLEFSCLDLKALHLHEGKLFSLGPFCLCRLVRLVKRLLFPRLGVELQRASMAASSSTNKSLLQVVVEQLLTRQDRKSLAALSLGLFSFSVSVPTNITWVYAYPNELIQKRIEKKATKIGQRVER